MRNRCSQISYTKKRKIVLLRLTTLTSFGCVTFKRIQSYIEEKYILAWHYEYKYNSVIRILQMQRCSSISERVNQISRLGCHTNISPQQHLNLDVFSQIRNSFRMKYIVQYVESLDLDIEQEYLLLHKLNDCTFQYIQYFVHVFKKCVRATKQ